MKKALIMIFVLAVLSITVYSVSYSKSNNVQITDNIGLESVQDCQLVTWTEPEPVYGECSYTEMACDDEPINKSCSEKTITYTCKTGEVQTEKSEEICDNNNLRLEVNTAEELKEYKLDYGEWGKCSYEKQGETLVITCDSKYDGNNDGICKPGESCTQFKVTKDNIQKLVKNSEYEFKEEDSTFFLEQLDLKEVPK